MAHEGGCHGEPGPLRPSPINAIGIVLEPEGGPVEARLWLRSDTVASAVPVSGAAEVELRANGTAWRLDEEAAGRYTTRASVEGDGLAPSYSLAFRLDPDVADDTSVYAGSFLMTSHGPQDRPDLWLDDPPTDAASLELNVSAGGLPLWLDVLDAEGVATWTNFTPFAADSPWPSLDRDSPVALPADAFPHPGSYTIRACALDVLHRDDVGATPQHLGGDDHLEGQLGWLSGMAVGRCTSLDVTLPPD
jgi:hypothetical protein